MTFHIRGPPSRFLRSPQLNSKKISLLLDYVDSKVFKRCTTRQIGLN